MLGHTVLEEQFLFFYKNTVSRETALQEEPQSESGATQEGPIGRAISNELAYSLNHSNVSTCLHRPVNSVNNKGLLNGRLAEKGVFQDGCWRQEKQRETKREE